MPTDLSDITWLFMEPQDVLLFRESRPFTAGESFWARSIFPPLSLPFLGALRAKIITERGVSFADYGAAVRGQSASPEVQSLVKQIGGFEDYGPLRAFGPFPARQGAQGLTLYFPVPGNLAGREEGGARGITTEAAVRLTPQAHPRWEGLRTNAPHGASVPFHFWASDERAGESERALLAAETLTTYLGGDIPYWSEERPIQERERRTGIALSAQRTVREGLLYTVEFIRMLEKDFERAPNEPAQRVGFVLGLRGAEGTGLLEAPARLLTLGGERRGASYEKVEMSDKLTALLAGTGLPKRLEKGKRKRFLLYLATPAVFRSGWYPDFLDAGNDFRGTVGDVGFRLIAAAAQKSVPLGGWNLGRGRPRMLYRAVPAGAVYVFEADEPLSTDDAEQLRERFHLQTLHPPGPASTPQASDAPGDSMHGDLTRLAQAGLGLTLLGATHEA